MCYTKKLISILLSSICVCPFASAMRSSISMPENISKEMGESLQYDDHSPYNFERLCDRTITMAPTTPIDTIIRETSYICLSTFDMIKSILGNKSAPSNRFYIANISNYEFVLEKINYIISDIILSKSDSIKQFFTPSKETKSSLVDSIFTVSSVLKKYENKLYIELFATHSQKTQTRYFYDIMNEIWDGLWKISQLNSFRNSL